MNSPTPGNDPKIREATIELLRVSTTLGLTMQDCVDVYAQCLANAALEVAAGDNKLAAQFIDEWLIPRLGHFRDHLAKGGRTVPVVHDGNRLQS